MYYILLQMYTSGMLRIVVSGSAHAKLELTYNITAYIQCLSQHIIEKIARSDHKEGSLCLPIRTMVVNIHSMHTKVRMR